MQKLMGQIFTEHLACSGAVLVTEDSKMIKTVLQS